MRKNGSVKEQGRIGGGAQNIKMERQIVGGRAQTGVMYEKERERKKLKRSGRAKIHKSRGTEKKGSVQKRKHKGALF